MKKPIPPWTIVWTMSSATSTKDVRLNADATADHRSVRLQPDGSLQPWQFFVLAGLGCATAVTFLARGQGLSTVVLLGVLMAATTLVGLAALRAFLPLVSTQEDRTAMVGQRTRVALEREKMLALRSIKELEFDRAMGKVSESDFREMSGRLRARASGLMRQLDAGGGYRDRIERDVAARLSSAKASAERTSVERASAEPPSTERPAIEHACSSCSTINDPDARFCKACGQKL
jgi:hypothetical protein